MALAILESKTGQKHFVVVWTKEIINLNFLSIKTKFYWYEIFIFDFLHTNARYFETTKTIKWFLKSPKNIYNIFSASQIIIHIEEQRYPYTS